MQLLFTVNSGIFRECTLKCDSQDILNDTLCPNCIVMQLFLPIVYDVDMFDLKLIYTAKEQLLLTDAVFPSN